MDVARSDRSHQSPESINVVVCGKSFKTHFVTLRSWTYLPIYFTDIIQQIWSKLETEGKSLDEFDKDSSQIYFIGISMESDKQILDELSNVNNLVHFNHVVNKNALVANSVNKSSDLRGAFDVKSSNIFKLAILPCLYDSSSRRTPSFRAAFPGVDESPQSKKRGSDRDTISHPPASITSGHFAMTQGYTKAYELISATAVQGYLPNELGIEFKLRNEDSPSRKLENKEILDIITETLPEKQGASEEIDIYGYVDYYNEDRMIDKSEFTSKRIHSIGYNTLKVPFPQSHVQCTDLRNAENL